jgi:hypothetical protein
MKRKLLFLSYFAYLSGYTLLAQNVGIGTSAPIAHLHLERLGVDELLLHSTTLVDNAKVKLKTGTGGSISEMALHLNAVAAVGMVMPTVGLAPAVGLANLGMLYTNNAPFFLGTSSASNLYFATGVFRTPSIKETWECLRINGSTGFVGVHTRNAASAGASGNPQAILHVNLTNPAQSTLNPLINGIRFEGLPTAPHPFVVVVDALGNLATTPTSSFGSGSAWQLGGNAIAATPTTYIGTNDPLDFNFRTSGAKRARITADGNLDFGRNNLFVNTRSAAFGDTNTMIGSVNSFAMGLANKVIGASTQSAIFGSDNEMDSSQHSFIAGTRNLINSKSFAVVALGGENKISRCDESVVLGELNFMSNAHSSIIAGGHNTSDGSYNVTIGEFLNTKGTFVHTLGYFIDNDLYSSLAVGFNHNRTMVVTERGVSIQVTPTSVSTHAPTHNLEVEAAPSLSKLSNIAFLHLPVTTAHYPTVVIDTITGELFRTPGYCGCVAIDSGIIPGRQLLLLEQQIKEQNIKLAEQQKQIDKLLTLAQQKTTASTVPTLLVEIRESTTATLHASIPNANTSFMNFELAATIKNATLQFADATGLLVQSTPIGYRGKGSFIINASGLNTALYSCTLVADGKPIVTKQMEINR